MCYSKLTGKPDMKARSRKQKGSRLEREFAELIRGYGLDPLAKRMPLSGAFSDPRMKADILTNLPFHFELKNQETWKPLEYFKQASETCGAKIPVVVMSRNREQLYTFMLATDFLKIIKYAIIGGYMGEPKIKVPKKPRKADLSKGLPFSKANQIGHMGGFEK